MNTYNIIASTDESTVVAEYKSESNIRSEKYQSEAELENEFIHQLTSQGYEYLTIHNEADLIANLRKQLEILNDITFTDNEWDGFFVECIANANEGIVEKTRRIQYDYIQILNRDDGTTKNIYFLDKKNVHNNRLQVINQYEETNGKHETRYDVTILINGLPIVHTELKRRGVALSEAFNQINRYNRDSFWAASGLFEYVQIFVISNGTHTKYYSNTTRNAHVNEQISSERQRSKKTSNSFEFTSFWADANNKNIPDLVDFTKTFFAKHTLLNILTKYCVYTTENLLLVLRPYQIVATEQILSQITISNNYKTMGTTAAGGYIWHTTGSGKTLTSFKTAQLVSALPYIDKVIFVVDRKDLDHQTMKEYDRFEEGTANGNTSTKVLQRQLEDRDKAGIPHKYNIIVTTIQKLDIFIRRNKQHDIYKKHVVLIFDECHRSQFGDMHRSIIKHFKNYHLFGFTGTPIFAINADFNRNTQLRTTEQAFGKKLHTYTIVDAINDENVLPFRIDFINTIKIPDNIKNINMNDVFMESQRISGIVAYILEHFNQKTKRNSNYNLPIKHIELDKQNPKKVIESYTIKRVGGFNSILATASIPMAIKYYSEFKKQIAENNSNLIIATIFSFSPNADEVDGLLPEEDISGDSLDQSARDFLESAIKDYNAIFKTNYDTSADKFENYYKDISFRMKNRDIDLLIVVNMFLTGFDATTLNTLWVDKNLRQHGLIQAFSRTNRILNRVKTYGNIICFRDLKKETDEAIALFGNKDAGGIVLLRTYIEYYKGYEENGKYKIGYEELINNLVTQYPLGEPIVGEKSKRNFIKLYNNILQIRNILTSFDDFEGNEILSERDFQDYQSEYIDLYQEYRKESNGNKENINDNITFEMELIKHIEVNIDYILMLVAKYRESNCNDKTILLTIDKAINSSSNLRSKKELIEHFLKQVNTSTKVIEDWQNFLRKSMKIDISTLINEEGLKINETRRFILDALHDRMLKITGTAIDKIMPPISRFDEVDRDNKKQEIIDKLTKFFEKYSGLL